MLGPEPKEIVPNLWGQESDANYNVARYWGRIQEYAGSVLKWRGLDDVLAEEMTVLPGMDEVGSLLWIADHHDSGDYDVIVVDAMIVVGGKNSSNTKELAVKCAEVCAETVHVADAEEREAEHRDWVRGRPASGSPPAPRPPRSISRRSATGSTR